MNRRDSRFRSRASLTPLVLVLALVLVVGGAVLFGLNRTSRQAEFGTKKAGQDKPSIEAVQGAGSGLAGAPDESNKAKVPPFAPSSPVAGSVGDLAARAPETVADLEPSFRPKHVAAARRLEPDLPRDVVWEKRCEDQESKDVPAEVLTPQSMVRSIKSDLDGHEEFPEGSHVVRWEMAFGLPRNGVLLWAEWLGTRPSTYRILIQDSRTPRDTWGNANRAPEQLLAEGLDWSKSMALLKERKALLTSELGPADYRRLIVTSESDHSGAPSEPRTGAAARIGATVGAELLGARVLWYSLGPVSCLRRDDEAMVCSCRRDVHH